MASTPQDVAALIQREGSGVSPDAYDASNEAQDTVTRRTKLLSPVLEALKTQDASTLEATAKALGDGSRDGKLLPSVFVSTANLDSCLETTLR